MAHITNERRTQVAHLLSQLLEAGATPEQAKNDLLMHGGVTEEEAQAAQEWIDEEDPDEDELCQCGHKKSLHDNNFHCTVCDCKDFQYA